ncbi:MAG: alpha/beta hydrolase [Saprospiraceae bacterium]
MAALPETPPRGWVIYWHGGGWQVGSPERFTVSSYAWLEAGYGVVLPSYRRMPQYHFGAIRADLITSLQHIKTWWSATVGHHTFPVILLGMSAGGHIASIAGLDKEIHAATGWDTMKIAGVIACAGVLDLGLMAQNPLIRRLAGSPDSDRFRAANPITHLHGQAPSFLLIHGTADGMVPYEAALSFRHQYQITNPSGSCELITMNKGTHLDTGYWMFQKGAIQDRVLQQADYWLSNF